MSDGRIQDLDHNSDDRDITNSLIDLSEFSRYAVTNKRSSKVSRVEWTEEIVGWRPSTSLEIVTIKTSNSGSTLKKKRSIDRSVTDMQYGGQFDDCFTNSRVNGDLRVGLRCVNDDLEPFPIPPWKANIEQGTYRYIPDNGSYRTMKFMYDERKDWYTIRKKYPEKVSSAWHQNCKRLQREMRRQLRKELNKAERENHNNSAINGPPSARNGVSTEPVSGSETSRSTFSLIHKVDKPSLVPEKPPMPVSKAPDDPQFANREYRVVFKAEVGPDVKAMPLEPTSKPLYRNENRIRSTHSDGAVPITRKMKAIQERSRESEPTTPLPNYSIPSGTQMMKSVSDLFIENFSSRITALEDEIRKDSKWLRKNEAEIAKLQQSRAKYREHTRQNLRDNGTSSVTPRVQRTETLASDIFSVKPVAQKDLKPLEKTRYYNRLGAQQTDDHSTDLHIGLSNKPFNNTPSHNSMSELDKGLNNSKSSTDCAKQALFNTLTGTKINTQSNKKSSKGLSAPATITICDTTPSAASGDQLNDGSNGPFKHIPLMVDKKSDKKTPIQAVPALLPEISGKRLEVTTISHRLL